MIQELNKDCFCISLDKDALRHSLKSEIGQSSLFELLEERCPSVFSSFPVFLSETQIARMAKVVSAIESVVALPAYRETVLARSPEAARHGVDGAKGVFMGYDFHVADDDFGLIEINTNAGGALLNAVLARAQRACCIALDGPTPSAEVVDRLESSIVDMFRQEWSQAGQKGPLRTIAIIDKKPSQQYLYPEFLLFKLLFQRHGIQAVIADPEEIRLHGDKLWHGDLAIDMAYNRLTDFSLSDPANESIRQAYLKKGVVLTPNPLIHALYADKRNLTIFSDQHQLQALGVSKTTQEILLEGVPATEVGGRAMQSVFGGERRRLFFKPSSGYGSRAAYRGDKLTRRVWEEILEGDFVAQLRITPGERAISDLPAHLMKFDLRTYVYNGCILWVAARLYQGQTTNFRTPEGVSHPFTQSPHKPASLNDPRQHGRFIDVRE